MQVQEHMLAVVPAGSCHCAYAVYANVPVADERGRYCSACGHYEFAARDGKRKQ